MVDLFLRWSSTRRVQVVAWVLFVVACLSLFVWMRRGGEPAEWFLIADLGFIAVYAVAFSGALHAVWGRTWLLLVPVTGVVADVVEDVLLLVAPQLSEEPALKAVEAVKLVCFWSTLLLVIVAAVTRKARTHA